MTVIILIGTLYLVMSTVCFFAYRADKINAMKGQWRTSETTLHLYELLGGWPGGLIAQYTLRHKNRKLVYQLVFWSIGALHLLVWINFNKVIGLITIFSTR